VFFYLKQNLFIEGNLVKGKRRDIMKKILFLLLVIATVLGACSLDTQKGTVVINFCDMDGADNIESAGNKYLECPEISLTSDAIDMTLVTVSSTIQSVDNVEFTLPDDSICSTSGTLTKVNNAYAITLQNCGLSSYAGQNTQLNFKVAVTLADSSTKTITGQAEDYVEN